MRLALFAARIGGLLEPWMWACAAALFALSAQPAPAQTTPGSIARATALGGGAIVIGNVDILGSGGAVLDSAAGTSAAQALGVQGVMGGVPLPVSGALGRSWTLGASDNPVLGAGANTIGSIANLSFGISGTLPAFAATPTVNLGALNGGALDASVQAVKTALGSPMQQTGGTVGIAPGANTIGTVGPYGYTPFSGAGQHGLAPTSAKALTVPSGAAYATICARTAEVEYTTDGSTPSASAGMPLAAGACVALSGPLVVAAFRAFSATGTLDVEYFR
ncbi:hypothetical protein DFR50_14240 [Roseiarcus fermentans]|uniref:Uncharacterized protein n=1 Tax=Roseiarcus fermentans TaxID=1473586 RepID=A0A366EMX9_9HYPH|nr:hypothetical protein [Roseiarcus fermentans]RBP03792.1 hypothetical protein DFR50_14240 [Roseiarcus fermentans]